MTHTHTDSDGLPGTRRLTLALPIPAALLTVAVPKTPEKPLTRSWPDFCCVLFHP
jgi:hypothetical protein